MSRAISPVIAIVVLMIMTVSAAGMAYITITTYQDEATSSSRGAVERLSRVGQSQIKVESISDGKLYLRSIGDKCEGVILQVGSEPAQELGDCAENLQVFTIDSECEGGYQTVKITAGGQTITQRVQCTELIGAPVEEEGECGSDSIYAEDAKNADQSFDWGEGALFAEKYFINGTHNLNRIDFLGYGNEAGTLEVRIVPATTNLSTFDPTTLTADGSTTVPTTNSWFSIDLDKQITGDFYLIANYSGTTVNFWSLAQFVPTTNEFWFCNYTSVNMGTEHDCDTPGMEEIGTTFPYDIETTTLFHFGSNLCEPGSSCSSGNCTPFFCDNGSCDAGENCENCPSDCGCTGGETCCSGVCTDLQSDPDNCNECGNECPAGKCCVSGTCQTCTLSLFHDGSSERTITFSMRGDDTLTEISLPANISIIEANMTVEGLKTPPLIDRTHAYNWGLSDTSSHSYDPSITSDPDGNIHLAWEDNETTNGYTYYDIYYAKWDKLTGEWNMTYGNDVTGGLVDDNGTSTEPQITSDPDGNIHLVWNDEYSTAYEQVYYAFWNKTTTFWNTTYASGWGLSNLTYFSSTAAVASDPSGKIHYAWYQKSPASIDIYYMYWDPATDEWNRTLAEGGGLSNTTASSHEPEITSDPDGNIHLVWEELIGDYEIYYAYWNKTTNKWNKTFAINGTGGFSNNTENSQGPSICSDPDGNIHIAWYDYTGTDEEIYYAYKNATNDEWNTSLATGEGLVSESYDSYAPQITSDSLGNIHITWYGDTQEVYYAYKNATTGEWNTTYAVSKTVSDNGSSSSRPTISVDDNKAHIAWNNQGLGGDFQIYYAVYGEHNPYNPNIDVGVDGDSQWNNAGEYSISQTVDFTSELDSFFPDCTCSGCTSSGTNCNVTFNVSSQTAGRVRLSDLQIAYALTE